MSILKQVQTVLSNLLTNIYVSDKECKVKNLKQIKIDEKVE
jgi:hypothetical protein